MKREDLAKLRPGDIVRHKTGNAYVVVFNDGRCITATRTISVTNPNEWDLYPAHPPLELRQA